MWDMCKQAIAADEVLVSLPREAALVVLPKQRSPWPQIDARFWMNDTPWFAKIALTLLKERSLGRQSR